MRCRNKVPIAIGGMVVTIGLALGGCEPKMEHHHIPDLAFHRARHAMEQGRWDWARVYLEEDLETNPKRYQSVRDLGFAWISGHGGGLARGVSYFEQYLGDHPEDQEIRRRLILTLIRLGRFDRGREWAVKLDNHLEAQFLRALLTADQDPLEALELTDKILVQNSDHGRALALRSRLFEETKQWVNGIEAGQRVLEIDPLNAGVRVRLERLLRKTGREHEADKQMRPIEIVGRLNQSRGAAILGPVEELYLLREIESEAGAAGFLFDLRMAEAMIRSGRVDEGLAKVRVHEHDSRFSTQDRLAFAKVLAAAGQRLLARNFFISVTERDPTNTAAQSSLAILDCELGRSGDACRRMDDALENDPWAAVYHATLAKGLLFNGQVAAAVASFETALQLAPWEDRWRKALASIWRAQGKVALAQAVLAEAPTLGGLALPVHTGRTIGEIGEVKQSSKQTAVHGRADEILEKGRWKDVSAEVGLDFVQYDGRSGQRYYVETTASGCGFVDFDEDGDLDVYFLTGAPTPGSTPTERPRNALFENQEGRFVDVTETAGVGDDGFGMGMCTGDVDGDGLLDLMVTNYGPDRLFRNLGEGRFEEISREAGVDDPRWSSNCTFGDVDDDGDLDLYVTHYLEAGFDDNPFCGDRARAISAYCRPSVFPGVTDSLFINSGEGVFTEEGGRRGLLQGQMEKGFGVVMTDLDHDGDLDIFVANDSTPNRLYVNDGSGYFAEFGLISGVGLNSEGLSTSGMGVDIGDVDGDLKQDLVLTNYAMESNGLYRNLGDLTFEDVSRSTGLSSNSIPQVGWGARLADFDNDGDLDLAIANGHVVDNIELFEPDNSYGQRNRLLFNDGSGTFFDVTDDAGSVWQEAKVSRALTIGDWNNDGRMDLLIANSNDRFELLENQIDTSNHWLGLKLIGTANNRAAIGARVVAKTDKLSMMREVRSGTGFQSQGDLRLHFGLGKFRGPVSLEIRWPDGLRQVKSVDEVDRYIVIDRQP